jgi:hypothetical protein
VFSVGGLAQNTVAPTAAARCSFRRDDRKLERVAEEHFLGHGVALRRREKRSGGACAMDNKGLL